MPTDDEKKLLEEIALADVHVIKDFVDSSGLNHVEKFINAHNLQTSPKDNKLRVFPDILYFVYREWLPKNKKPIARQRFMELFNHKFPPYTITNKVGAADKVYFLINFPEQTKQLKEEALRFHFREKFNKERSKNAQAAKKKNKKAREKQAREISKGIISSEGEK